jgi:NADH dehydrogenase [ubiquinone] 1 alpha subcomplex assembly factor 1
MQRIWAIFRVLLWGVIMTGSAASSSLNLDAPQTAWLVVNDGVMGGVSSSAARVQKGVLLWSGRVSLERNGGFASLRSRVGRYDLSGVSSVRIRVRGDGKRYGFQLGTSSARNVLYRSEFVTQAGQWLELEFPLAGFRPTRFGNVLRGPALDSKNLEHFGFIIANGKAEDFSLELDWIRAP